MKTIRFNTAALVAALGVAFTVPANASAQDTASRISVEGRIGVGIPTGDISDAGGGAGLALGADLMYTFVPTLTGYAGISRHMFSCDEDEGCNDDFTAGGFQVGLKFLMAREANVLPWLRAGLIGQTLDSGPTSDLGLGFEAGAGLDLALTHRFSVVPAFTFRSFSPGGDDFDDVTASWFALTLGAHLHF